MSIIKIPGLKKIYISPNNKISKEVLINSTRKYCDNCYFNKNHLFVQNPTRKINKLSKKIVKKFREDKELYKEYVKLTGVFDVDFIIHIKPVTLWET